VPWNRNSICSGESAVGWREGGALDAVVLWIGHHGGVNVGPVRRFRSRMERGVCVGALAVAVGACGSSRQVVTPRSAATIATTAQRPTTTLGSSPTTTTVAQQRGSSRTARTVSCKTQNTHPAYYPPTGFIPGPVIPKTVQPGAGVGALAGLSLFAEALPHSKYSDQLAVLAPSGWDCLGSLYEDGAGAFDVYPRTAASQFTWTKTSTPQGNAYKGPLVSLRTNWLGHGTTPQMMCPWLSDNTFTRRARQIDPTASCSPPTGAQVTHVASDISRITFPDGTLGAAISTGSPTNGTATILRCQALADTTCRAVVDDYVTRVQMGQSRTLARTT